MKKVGEDNSTEDHVIIVCVYSLDIEYERNDAYTCVCVKREEKHSTRILLRWPSSEAEHMDRRHQEE